LQGNPDGSPNLELSREHYEQSYAKTTREQLDHEQRGADLIWKPALVLARGKVLDIGCGLGHLSFYARAGYVGVDYSAEAVRLARLTYPLGTFHVAEVPPLPEIVKADYHTAMLLEVLEHVYDDMALLAAVPEGKRVVLSVPNYQTDGHCRWFATPSQVLDRYKTLLDYSALRATAAGNNRWWIVAGVRV